MQIGDKIIWGEREYTCWLIVDDICHLITDDGIGVCMTSSYILQNDLKI